MTHCQRRYAIVAGRAVDRCGFWPGTPETGAGPIHLDDFDAVDEEGLRGQVQDDAGCDGLRPLQARAENMNGDTVA